MDCPYVPVISYGDFSRRLHEKVAGQRIPITGSIEVTARCNLRCVHCYINIPAGDRGAMERELGSQEFCHLLDQMADEGCLWLLLTGGEPFLRTDFLDIYTYAKKKGFLVTLFTNGTTITPHIADHLAELPPFVVEITLYGRTEKTYERITGIPGSYARCMQGISLLLQRNVPLKLKTMVLTLNRHEIWAMKEYARTLGVEFRFDPVLNVRIDGGRRPADFRVSPEEVAALDLADEKRLKSWKEFCDNFWGPPPHPQYLYQCGAGVTSFHIDPYGALSTCMMARVPSYDLLGGTFHEGWDNFMPRVRKQKWSRQSPCKNCELISLCGQCPGWGQMESGDPEAPVEYLCKIAHARAEGFGLKRKHTEKTDAAANRVKDTAAV